MKFPIDIEAWVQKFKEQCPDNPNGVVILRAMLPMVNEAYAQGLKDAKSERGAA